MKLLKVLIVDDNEGLAAVIQHTLDHEGYDTRIARDGAEAYGIFLAFRPTLVISDLHMQEENGIQLVRRMRKVDSVDLKTIYMSGDLDYFRSELENERKDYRVTLLAKPFRRVELLRLVSEFELGSAYEQHKRVSSGGHRLVVNR